MEMTLSHKCLGFVGRREVKTKGESPLLYVSVWAVHQYEKVFILSLEGENDDYK